MGIYESLTAIQNADRRRMVDWQAAADAAVASTPRGSLGLDLETEESYRTAVIEARDAVSATVGIEIDLPETIEIVDRHHWIEQAATSFGRMLDPVMATQQGPDLARYVNTGSAAFTLAVLGRRVVGQYEPALFGDVEEMALYVVHPNVQHVATELAVDEEMFRQWILHHEVTHAAEFDLAPWLKPHLETQLSAVLSSLASGRFDHQGIAALTRTMTVIEGFAELLMDASIEADVTTLRDRLEAKRAGLGPIQQLVDWLLGITAKREQYAKGREFFLTIEQNRGITATLEVWDAPENLPTQQELRDPMRWIERVDP